MLARFHALLHADSAPAGERPLRTLALPEALRARLANELDREQFAAACADHPAMVMLAAAGAGKTRTLTARVEALCAVGVAPSEVVITTFTRKAAEELVERLAARGIEGTVTGTFHALCLRWLRRASHPLAAPDSRLGDAARAAAVRTQILREVGHDASTAHHRQVEQTATRLANRMLSGGSADGIAQAAAGPMEPAEAARVAEVFMRARLAAGAPDFDDLQRAVLDGLLAADPAIDGAVGRVAALLVDEAQDLSPLQAAIVDRLRARGAAVALVGDDDQAIYGFRASDPSFLVARAQDSAWRTFRIGTNYRSTARIVRAADRLVRCNRVRAGKEVRANAGRGAAITHRAYRSLREEAVAVAHFVAERAARTGGGEPAVAVLVRNNAHAGPYELACLNAGLRVRRLGEEGTSLLAREALAPVASWLRWVLDGTCEEAREEVFAWASVPDRGGRRGTREGLVERRRRLRRGMARGWSAGRWLRTLLDEHVPDDPGWRGRVEDSDTLALLEAAARDSGSLGWLVAGVRCADGEGADVVVGTIHRSKGREWPAVWLPQMQEGVLPSRGAASDPAQLEEERRVAYVAWTRAARELVVSWVPSRGQRSRFVLESSGWWTRLVARLPG